MKDSEYPAANQGDVLILADCLMKTMDASTTDFEEAGHH